MALVPRCRYCSSTITLSRCTACKLTPYCSRDHRVIDRTRHARECKAIKQTRVHMELEDRKLRLCLGAFRTASNPFEDAVGQFWGIPRTRDYMRARFAFVEALVGLATWDAVECAVVHARDMLWLCDSDDLGVRHLLPALLLRLGRERECYEFVKGWGQADSMQADVLEDEGELDVEDGDADVFEDVGFLCGESPDLVRASSVALLKIRLLLDLKGLQNAAFLEKKLPVELADRVRCFIPFSSIIRGNSTLLASTNHARLIEILEAQIDTLFKATNKANKHFWRALVRPAGHLGVRPDAYSLGSVEEMQLKLAHCFDTWQETPGAIDVIRGKLKG